MSSTDSFPRRYARTQRFSLGVPRNIAVSGDGQRVVYLCSTGGSDPVNRLWVTDLPETTPRLVADPTALSGADEGELPPAERARRERLRESAGGIVAFSLDRETAIAAFTLSGLLFVTDLTTGATRSIETHGPAFGPRLSPDGSMVAYVSGSHLRIVDLASTADGSDADRPLTETDQVSQAAPADNPETVSWGAAEFVAAEEMGRNRGFWWSPESDQLLVARVDVAPVPIWHIGDPNHPEQPPVANRYPAAGTANAEVRLYLFDQIGAGGAGSDGASQSGPPAEISWDRDRFEYLADVHWSAAGPPLLTVQTRDQRTVDVRTIDIAARSTTSRHQITDPHWVELIPGTPVWQGSKVVTVEDTATSRQLCLDGDPISPEGLEVRSVVDVSDDQILVHASTEATELHVHALSIDAHATALTTEPGVHRAAGNGETIAVISRTMDADQPRVQLRVRDSGSPDGFTPAGELEVHAADFGIDLQAKFISLGRRKLRSAILLPSPEHDPGGDLPVLLDPYGGPHALRVQRARSAMVASQWLADQGFAVLVTDGRGTPGRGPAWEREVAGDLATKVLDDQVDALAAAAEAEPRIDASRVGIRGWSFGGYLAALAVLRRPDVFGAAIAGAPVTEWRFYDTHYTERYLGHPDTEPGPYDISSLLPEAPKLDRPLLLIHGLADDNVLAIHTLRLSQALLEAGRPHQVLPLSGVTHMTPQEEVAENLLRLQVDFLHNNL